MHPLLMGAPTVPTHPYNLDQLLSEDGTVTIEQSIMSAEEETIDYSGSSVPGLRVSCPT
ncbi:MAG: hypothetical protein ABIP43_13840 [Nitrospiraceae bacterium]